MGKIWSSILVWGSLIPPIISPQNRALFLFEIYREILEQNFFTELLEDTCLKSPEK